MRYFGVPTCPYCKKRVNLIRTWSLKKQGEYQCPRCGGISNIFLSPLIYVFALLAVFSGGALYFFHKFVLDDVSLDTLVQVLFPFIIFFLLSLFMVYLAKPVIKKVSRAEMEKKKRGRSSYEDRRVPAANAAGQQMFYDSDEYLPQIDYRTGPLPQMEDDRDMKVLPDSPRRNAYSDELQKTSVVQVSPSRTGGVSQRPVGQAQGYRETRPQGGSAPVRIQQEPVRRPAQAQASASVSRPAARPGQSVQPGAVQRSGFENSAASANVSRETSTPARTVTSVNIPGTDGDFFAKYNDPEYVERRLRELNGQKGGKSE